jgi:hypothetical protein
MSSAAGVLSIERLEHLKEALARFINDGQTALGLAEMEIRRTQETLEDRLRYWQGQEIRCREAMAQARSALSHARAMHDGKRTGCVEQELELRKAQQRLRDAEEKIGVVKRWLRELPAYIKEYETPARILTGFLEADLRQAVVQLENKIAALHAYVAVAPSQTTVPS